MRMGVGGWIGVIVGGLGGLIGMVVAIAASPVFGSIMAFVFIVVFGGVFWAIYRPMIVQNKIMKTGVSATATILEVRDTGVTVNNSPQIKLLLQVTPPMGMQYKVEMKLLISRLQTYAFQPGMTIAVKIDPNDKDKIAIDNSGSASDSNSSSYSSGYSQQQYFTPQQIQEIQSDLKKTNDENLKLMSYGESAKAIVLKYTDTNVKVNGENPAVVLDLEVIPMTRSPFKATAKGVIMQTSVPKFQPGEEIFVKFDPNDTSKVTVEHS
jgi:hypothetical protein